MTDGASGRRRQVILVSNRGPVQYGTDDQGRRTASRGAGGLVTALSGLGRELGGDAVWVCAAMSDEDGVVATEAERGEVQPGPDDGPVRVRMVTLDPSAREGFYNVIANPLLWFVSHYLYDHTRAPNITRVEYDAFEYGYAAVNERFAEVVAGEVEAADGDAVVMIQDYHFYLLPQQLRERTPEAVLHHFVHIPWPQPDSWRVLPPFMRDAIFRGLLGNDVVGFHTERYARNFLLGCQELLGLEVDLKTLEVRATPGTGESTSSGGRVVRARWYPISIDPAAFEERAASPAVADEERRLTGTRKEYLIVRVDRTDPSKNIVRGFEAFGILLGDHPELAGRVHFLALLQPSRLDVPEYADYLERIQRVAADVNLKHGTADWQPIDLRLEENMDLAVAAYKQFDVLMVNAIFDGMNLVAKEAILVNTRDGVLALSENTGVHEELGAFAVTLHPFDLQQQADALFAALAMPAAARRARQSECVRIVRENDVDKWLRIQMSDAGQLAPEPEP